MVFVDHGLGSVIITVSMDGQYTHQFTDLNYVLSDVLNGTLVLVVLILTVLLGRVVV